MTTKPMPAQTTVRPLPPLPDPPKEIGDMLEYSHFEMLGDGAALGLHFQAYPRRADSKTLISGKAYLCHHRRDLNRRGQSVYPDLLVAFDVDPIAITDNRGYEISQVGKPPALALELASGSTGINDYTWKRETYANFGVQEYWRFDPTGGDHHDAPLAGDRLTEDGIYQPIQIQTEPNGVAWGYSEVLKLSLCWVPAAEKARLRFWNPATESYIPDQEEEREDRIAAQEIATIAEERANTAEQRAAAAEYQAAAEREARTAAEQRANAAEQRAAAEHNARTAAEERIRQLEQQLRRLHPP